MIYKTLKLIIRENVKTFYSINIKFERSTLILIIFNSLWS